VTIWESKTNRRNRNFLLTLLLPVLVTAWLASPLAEARPEKIRPGVAHYSDGFETRDGVSDIAQERNYEEVYNNYEFYEARYDEKERIVRFIAYKRGQVDWEERYLYREGERPYAKEVIQSDGSKKTVELK